VNHKGGTGKSTMASHICFYYREQRKKVLLVDLDGQHNAIDYVSGYTWDGEDIWYDKLGLIAATTNFNSHFIRNYPGDIVFDCPPSIEANTNLIRMLKDSGIRIDVWHIPVESRTSIKGADTIRRNIISAFPDSRLIMVPYKFSNNVLTRKDKAELVQYRGAELYDQVIPLFSLGLTEFEQNGERPVWEIYSRTSFAIAFKEYCKWTCKGCPVETLNRNKKRVGGGIFGKASREIGKAVLMEITRKFIETSNNKKREYGEYIEGERNGQ